MTTNSPNRGIAGFEALVHLCNCKNTRMRQMTQVGSYIVNRIIFLVFIGCANGPRTHGEGVARWATLLYFVSGPGVLKSTTLGGVGALGKRVWFARCAK